MKVILQRLKRTDHLIRRRLDTFQPMYIILLKNYRGIFVIHFGHRELLYITADSLQIIASSIS